MSNPTLTRNFTTGGAIAARRFVMFGSADHTIVQADGATALIVGASTELAAASGARCDAHLAGIVEVEAGGSITRGVKVTSDANGKAVAAAPAAGVNNQIGGIAMVSASSGDVMTVLLSPHTMQGA